MTPSSQTAGRAGRFTSLDFDDRSVSNSNWDDYDEFDGDVSGHSRSKLDGAHYKRAQKGDKRSKNPFVEFEDREKRVILKRQWLLEEDGAYMQERKKDLKHNHIQKHMDVETQEADDLYDGRVFWGPLSINIRSRPGPGDRPAAIQRDVSRGKRNPMTKKGDSADVFKTRAQSLSCVGATLKVKELQRKIEDLKRHVEDDEPTKLEKKMEKAKDFFRRTSFQTQRRTSVHKPEAGRPMKGVVLTPTCALRAGLASGLAALF